MAQRQKKKSQVPQYKVVAMVSMPVNDQASMQQLQEFYSMFPDPSTEQILTFQRRILKSYCDKALQWMGTWQTLATAHLNDDKAWRRFTDKEVEDLFADQLEALEYHQKQTLQPLMTMADATINYYFGVFIKQILTNKKNQQYKYRVVWCATTIYTFFGQSQDWFWRPATPEDATTMLTILQTFSEKGFIVTVVGTPDSNAVGAQ